MWMVDRVKQDTNLEYIIPNLMGYDHFLAFSIRGFKTPTLNSDDRIMLEVCIIFNSILKSLENLYVEQYVFTDPLLMFMPDSSDWTMKIGMLTKEKFEKMKEPALNP
jgi:hypothetical protein